MVKAFTPEDILPDGDDYTIAVNPFTGVPGKARKGIVAATLQNIALLDRLFSENAGRDQITEVRKAVEPLMASLKAVGLFDFFHLKEWIHPEYLGRTYVAFLYLKHYPEEINEEIIRQFESVKKTLKSHVLRSELSLEPIHVS